MCVCGEFFLYLQVVVIGLIWLYHFIVYALGVDKYVVDGEVLQPVGAYRFKNWIAYLIVKIGRFTRPAEVASMSVVEKERFHREIAEDDPHFNESFYWAGQDDETGAIIVTRLARRGRKGTLVYAFLLLEIPRRGRFTMEKDFERPLKPLRTPDAFGLSYTVVKPGEEWKMSYHGELKKGLSRADPNDVSESVSCELDFTFRASTPIFIHGSDDSATCLGKLLAQEDWSGDFWKKMEKRSEGRAHYEQFGRLFGTVKIGQLNNEISFGTFRDHSWDIRHWSAMKYYFSIMVTLRTPLTVHGKEWDILFLIMASLPENSAGLRNYVCGYLGRSYEHIQISHITDIDELSYVEDENGFLSPDDENTVSAVVPSPVCCGEDYILRIHMRTNSNRVQYWPDGGEFNVFDDGMEYDINGVSGYGVREIGFKRTKV